MNRISATLLLLALAGGLLAVGGPSVTAQPAPAGQPPVPLERRYITQVAPLLGQYCFACHGNGKSKGDVSLDKFVTFASVQADKKTWSKVAEMVREGEMPPSKKPQPTPAEREFLNNFLEELIEGDCTGPRDPGHLTIHRLNRAEYNNTIRDLVGVDFRPAAEFPADDTGYGFDNMADVLTMSPLLMEKYLNAAEQVMDKAIVSENPAKKKIVRISGTSMDATASNSGGNLMVNGECFKMFSFPADGEYEFRIRASQDPFGDEPARMTFKIDQKEIKTFEVKALRGLSTFYKVRLPVSAGKRRIAAAYINNAKDETNPDRRKRGDRNLYVELIEVEGPFNAVPPPPPESHRRLLFVTPSAQVSEESAARQVLTRFAGKAFRRPATVAEVNRLMKVFAVGKQDGQTFEQAIKLPLTAVLVSPHFLYRIELDPINSDAIHPITDYELATRLSYFLWSSMPDDELMKLAEAKKLHEPAVLDAQVKRMLADAKADQFYTNFPGQWLELRNLDEVNPSQRLFPNFNGQLRRAMRREAELFFANIAQEDRSILELLSADYTFVNSTLAKLYGIPGVNGANFVRVPLPPNLHRGGVLTMAGVLTVTSMPARTSPVKRGKWVLEELLGTPPPPPPPDVPALKERNNDGRNLTFRQRLEEHRANPICASCHERMDPLGFSLENFDAIGAWREKEGSIPVDATGMLPNGQSLAGADDLRRVLVERKKDFVRALTEKMLMYALGRGIEPSDRCTVKDICANVEKGNYRFSALVQGIVKSDAFLKRRGKKGTP
jgi:mono/diheme cytochrome c family protein